MTNPPFTAAERAALGMLGLTFTGASGWAVGAMTVEGGAARCVALPPDNQATLRSRSHRLHAEDQNPRRRRRRSMTEAPQTFSNEKLRKAKCMK